ncbi:hypothetical protein CIPAW_07G063700 [Carya illinoinensis]|uniref:Uncharacterized protein n=1 Tax=Carya illinoinensis TaxID=32201 RepID=A0A8T1Q0B2_CARIL|nr:hypothetical protein CIPAW_07G063700 [Carya illinoinensis]
MKITSVGVTTILSTPTAFFFSSFMILSSSFVSVSWYITDFCISSISITVSSSSSYCHSRRVDCCVSSVESVSPKFSSASSWSCHSTKDSCILLQFCFIPFTISFISSTLSKIFSIKNKFSCCVDLVYPAI